MGLTKQSVFAVTGLLVVPALPAFAEGDPERGESVFRQCSTNNAIGEGARTLNGPTFDGLPETPAANDDKQKCCSALLVLRDEGIVWPEENPDAFMGSRCDFAPLNRMPFPGMRNPQDRADPIAYVAQFADVQ